METTGATLNVRTLGFQEESLGETIATSRLEVPAHGIPQRIISYPHHSRSLTAALADHSNWQPDSTAYKMPLALELTGTLNPLALEKALTQSSRDHENLRTTVSRCIGNPVQIVAQQNRVPSR